MNGPVLNKLSPDTQRKECHKQHSTAAKQESLFFLIFSVFLPPKTPHPLFAPAIWKAGLATDWELTCNFYRSSQWVGGRGVCVCVTDIIKWKVGRIQASMFTGKIECCTFFCPFCFICPFCFQDSSLSTGDLVWVASEAAREVALFLFFKIRSTAWSEKNGVVSCEVYYVSYMWFGLLRPSTSNSLRGTGRVEQNDSEYFNCLHYSDPVIPR